MIAEDIHIVLPLSENILPQEKINASRSIFRAADFKTILLNSAADVKQIKPSREARGTPCYLKKHVTGSGGPGDTLNPLLRHPMRREDPGLRTERGVLLHNTANMGTSKGSEGWHFLFFSKFSRLQREKLGGKLSCYNPLKFFFYLLWISK